VRARGVGHDVGALRNQGRKSCAQGEHANGVQPTEDGAGDGTALEVVCCLIYCGLILGALEQHSTVEQLMIPMIPMKILPLRIARKSMGMAHHFISERALSADILVWPSRNYATELWGNAARNLGVDMKVVSLSQNNCNE
jgi:hypothetical protein